MLKGQCLFSVYHFVSIAETVMFYNYCDAQKELIWSKQNKRWANIAQARIVSETVPQELEDSSTPEVINLTANLQIIRKVA